MMKKQAVKILILFFLSIYASACAPGSIGSFITGTNLGNTADSSETVSTADDGSYIYVDQDGNVIESIEDYDGDYEYAYVDESGNVIIVDEVSLDGEEVDVDATDSTTVSSTSTTSSAATNNEDGSEDDSTNLDATSESGTLEIYVPIAKGDEETDTGCTEEELGETRYLVAYSMPMEDLSDDSKEKSSARYAKKSKSSNHINRYFDLDLEGEIESETCSIDVDEEGEVSFTWIVSPDDFNSGETITMKVTETDNLTGEKLTSNFKVTDGLFELKETFLNQTKVKIEFEFDKKLKVKTSEAIELNFGKEKISVQSYKKIKKTVRKISRTKSIL